MSLFAIKYSKQGLLAHFLLLVIIFVSDDTLTFGTAKGSTVFVKYAIYAILLALLAAKECFDVNVKKSTVYVFVISLSIFLTLFLNVDVTGGYIFQLFVVLLGFLIVRNLQMEDYVRIFNKILCFLCCVSIIVFIVANSFRWLLDYFPVYENVAGVEFINLYIAGVFKDITEVRNTSIFREPGVYMIYILLGIIFELFYFEKPRLQYVIVFFITLLTTFSTAGILVSVVIVSNYFLSANKRANWLKVSIILAFLGLVTYVALNGAITANLFSKMNKDSSSYVSTLARMASVVVNFFIFTAHPLFGSGLTNYVSSFETYTYALYGIRLSPDGISTNSFMSILATYGLVYGGIVIIAFYRLTKVIVRPRVQRLVLFLAFLLMFSNEDMRYSLFFYSLVFWGLVSASSKTKDSFPIRRNREIAQGFSRKLTHQGQESAIF